MRNTMLAIAMILLGGGCASYVAPGRGADLRAFGITPAEVASQTDIQLRATLAKKPLAGFPTAVAVARVQDSGYRSVTAEGFGAGRYSVVTTRDIEKEEHIERLSKLPMVRGVAPVNRLLLPRSLQSDLELRHAAAALNCDILLIYTLDTTFRVDERAAPLTVISLGLAPNKRAKVVCTASAAFLDTRNGYVYGVAEATEKADQLTMSWTSQEAVDQSRRRAEAAAFEKLVGEIETTWRGVVGQYATTQPTVQTN